MRDCARSRLVLLATVMLVFVILPSDATDGARAEEITTIATPCTQYGAWRMAMDSNNVYWTDFAGGTVAQAPLRGGGTTTILASGQPGPCGIAVDRKWVYWTNNRSGSVMKTRIGGGPLVTVASGELQPSVLGVSDGVLYCSTLNALRKFNVLDSSGRFMAEDVHPSGPTVHCELCADYCTRTVCDTKSCRDERYVCGYHSCNCRG